MVTELRPAGAQSMLEKFVLLHEVEHVGHCYNWTNTTTEPLPYDLAEPTARRARLARCRPMMLPRYTTHWNKLFSVKAS